MSLTVHRAILGVSSILQVLIGPQRLWNPQPTFALVGVKLPNDVNVMSEARSIGAFMMSSGLVILASAVLSKDTASPWLLVGHVAAVVDYGSFALGRVVGISKDGQPSSEIKQGLIVEIIVTVLNLVGLWILLE